MIAPDFRIIMKTSTTESSDSLTFINYPLVDREHNALKAI
jgi:hypothetical protein